MKVNRVMMSSNISHWNDLVWDLKSMHVLYKTGTAEQTIHIEVKKT